MAVILMSMVMTLTKDTHLPLKHIYEYVFKSKECFKIYSRHIQIGLIVELLNPAQ